MATRGPEDSHLLRWVQLGLEVLGGQVVPGETGREVREGEPRMPGAAGGPGERVGREAVGPGWGGRWMSRGD